MTELEQKIHDNVKVMSHANQLMVLQLSEAMKVAQGNPPESVRVEKSAEDKTRKKEDCV